MLIFLYNASSCQISKEKGRETMVTELTIMTLLEAILRFGQTLELLYGAKEQCWRVWL